MRRLLVRARSARRPGAGLGPRLLDHAVLAAVLVSAASLVVVVLVRAAGDPRASTQTTGLWPLLQAQAVNAVSLTLLAAAAAGWYRLRYRQARSTYLARYRQQHVSTGVDNGDDALTPTIVGQLLDVRPPRSSLVVSDDPDDGARVLDRVAAVVAGGARGHRDRLLPVTVDVSGADDTTSVPALARQCFVRLFSTASPDTGRAERVLRGELRRHRVVVIVAGLDRVAEARSVFRRRQVVEALLRSCVAEGVPFVSTVPQELVTPMSDVAVLRGGPPGPGAQVEELMRALTQRQARDPALRPAVHRAIEGLAADGQFLRRWEAGLAADVVTAAVRAGRPAGSAVAETFRERDPMLRRLGWMAERTGTGRADGPSGSRDATVPTTLAALGTVGHRRQEVTIRESRLWSLVGDALAVDVGLWTLARRRVVAVSDDDDRLVRFTQPDWFSYAGATALGLDARRWTPLLTPGVSQATLEALTMALATADPTWTQSPAETLDRLRPGHHADATLEMLTASVRGLACGGHLELGNEDVVALERAWRVSSEQTRLAFVAAAEPHPRLASFLWSRALPAPDGNPYRVRRAATRRLAAMGTPAWRQLATTWQELVVAAERSDLGAFARSTDPSSAWVRVGRPVATLGWTLPSLVAALEGQDRDAALELLTRMRELVAPPGTPTVENAPEVGLEISLAEGIKLAAATRPATRPPDTALLTHGLGLFRSARSWSSKLVLLQALALSGHAHAGEREAAQDDAPDVQGASVDRQAHPFVREAAALALRSRARADRGSPHGEQDAWVDDVQSLQDGGLELSAEAHRLLGLSTLLVNLAEHLVRPDDRPPTREELRHRTIALTSKELPPCFTRGTHTATMFQVDCDCGLGLCGPGAVGTVGDRRFSRVFTQRAEVTAGASPLTRGHPFVTRGFARVWRRDEMVAEDLTEG